MINPSLPAPSMEALAHSNQLLEYILSQIKIHHGSISFSQYMEFALYTPQLGYYSAGTKKFGEKGDFITAPEISPLFSQCLAHQCQQILTHFLQGDILEIGAGSGKMAAHLLMELSRIQALPKHYFILELSASLKKQQEETLASLCPELLHKVVWLNAFPTSRIQGVILANEVLDAMPVSRFQIQEKKVYEIKVQATHDQLNYVLSKEVRPEIHALYYSQPWPTHYISEINLNLTPWIFSISDVLEAGVVLLIDYGFPEKEYYHPQRSMGTLMCHYRHYAHTDPFLYPGLQDITAHVNFTHVAEAALQSQLEILGYTHQAAFLLGCGLLEFLKIESTNEKSKVLQNSAVHKLTSPAEMGELFKVIALGRQFEEPLIGFSLIDKRYAL